MWIAPLSKIPKFAEKLNGRGGDGVEKWVGEDTRIPRYRTSSSSKDVAMYGHVLVGGLEAGKAGIPCGREPVPLLQEDGRNEKGKSTRRWRWRIERRRGRRSLGFSADRDSTDKSASLVASVIAIVPTKGDKSPRLKPFPLFPVSITTSGYVCVAIDDPRATAFFRRRYPRRLFTFLDLRNLLRIAIGIRPFNRGVTRATYIEKIGNRFP